jgi:hypothetical protein
MTSDQDTGAYGWERVEPTPPQLKCCGTCRYMQPVYPRVRVEGGGFFTSPRYETSRQPVRGKGACVEPSIPLDPAHLFYVTDMAVCSAWAPKEDQPAP